MYVRLRRWWASGSPLWQRLVVCGTVAVTAYAAGLAAKLLDGHVLLVFGLIVVAFAALSVGAVSLGMAWAGGEHIYSPRWYRKFQQEARARAAGSPQ